MSAFANTAWPATSDESRVMARIKNAEECLNDGPEGMRKAEVQSVRS